jgi:hypothetical protein
MIIIMRLSKGSCNQDSPNRGYDEHAIAIAEEEEGAP